MYNYNKFQRWEMDNETTRKMVLNMVTADNDETELLQNLIDECAARGGGTVEIEAGVHLIRGLRLRSNINLHLAKDAVLLASPKLEDHSEWTDVKHIAYPDALPRKRNASVILADEAENVSITGEGVIDGNGENYVREKTGDWTGWQFERKVPPEQSLPRVCFFTGCRNVIIRGVTLKNPPSGWSWWFHDCDNVLIENSNVKADVRYPNNDGFHINSCRDVIIRNCDIETGDDSIVVRANNRSLADNKVCERVLVTDCTLRSWASGIRIGWTNDGIIRNCRFQNIKINDTNVGFALFLPPVEGTDFGREATRFENLVFENIRMRNIYGRPILSWYAPVEKGTLIDGFYNIVFRNVRSYGLEKPLFRGRKETPIKGVSFENCRFDIVSDIALPGYIRHGSAAWDRHLGETNEYFAAVDKMFSSHMVFAKNNPIRVFGTGAGEIEVEFAGKTVRTIAEGGKWSVEFPPMPAGGPYELIAKVCGETFRFEDVMVGTVVLCAGQSNMQFKLEQSSTPKSEWRDDPQLRAYFLQRPGETEPHPPEDGWVPCTAAGAGTWSALGYHIGHQLRERTGEAIGIVHGYQGASIIEAWIPKEISNDPRFIMSREDMFPDHWNKEYAAFNIHGFLFEKTILPLAPYAVSHVVWYQGESNAGRGESVIYPKLFAELAKCWRATLRQPELPFVVVQIADYDPRANDIGWKNMQKAQLTIPEFVSNSTVVRSADVCESNDIHPKTKDKLAARVTDAIIAQECK